MLVVPYSYCGSEQSGGSSIENDLLLHFFEIWFVGVLNELSDDRNAPFAIWPSAASIILEMKFQDI